MREISVYCAEDAGPQRHFWQSTGFTPAKLLLDADMDQTLAYVGSIPNGGVTHARIHLLLDLVKATGLGTPAPRYDWSDLDRGIDRLTANGLKPFFELMGNPSGWFSDFNNDGQLHAWRRLVRDLARHLMDRYGRTEVESWYFETWNEPDAGWWHQWPQEQPFCRYYDACSEGLREANPKLIFGGPGSCKHLSPLLKAMLAHCDTGTNYFTGETGVRLDFVSVHEKGAWPNQEEITPDTAGITRRELAILDYIAAHHPRLRGLPFMNNECDPIVGWGHTHTWHARPYYAALIARVINQHQVKIVEERGCDYPILSNDNGFIGRWGMRTHLAKLGTKQQIERGEFELIKKPALNVMALLALLGDRRVRAAGCGDPLEDEMGVMATRRGGDQVAVLVYHTRDRLWSSGSERVSLAIDGVPFARGTLTHYRIDEAHGDPFAIWEAHGARDCPDADILARLRDAMEPAMLEPPPPAPIRGGRVALEFDLPLHAVSLILLTRETGQPPERVTGLRAAYCPCTSDRQNVLLRWNALPSRAVRTYEVLFSESAGDAPERVNAPDLLCSAFMHARKTRRGAGRYRVRAVDYSGRAGPESDEIEA